MGFEPMTSAMPVQCSHQLSYEVTQWRAGQFVGLMFSRVAHSGPHNTKLNNSRLPVYYHSCQNYYFILLEMFIRACVGT